MRKLIAPLVSALALSLWPAPAPSRAQHLAATRPSSFAALEQEVANEINFARTRPTEYAALLERLRAQYNGREFRPAGRAAYMTEEGVGALNEAVSALRAAKPAPTLEVSSGMCSGARELAAEQAASGATGHKGADGSFCEQRVGRFGRWVEPIGENLSYGEETARERVTALLIDDGFANRGHRQRLLNPAFKVVGVACGGHKLGAVCVITLAGGFNVQSPAGRQQPAGKPQPAAKSPAATAAPAGARRF